jgi:hypothetical protein
MGPGPKPAEHREATGRFRFGHRITIHANTDCHAEKPFHDAGRVPDFVP